MNTLEVKVNTPDKLVILSTDQGGARPKKLTIKRHKEGKRNVDIYVSHGDSDEEIYLDMTFTEVVSAWLTTFLANEPPPA